MPKMTLKQAHDFAKNTVPDLHDMSDEQLKSQIEDISNSLKGSGIGQLERLALHEDRKKMRLLLAQRTDASPV